MSTNKIKQHYVPQFYLRRFSCNGESIQVYDKFGRKTYEANIRNVAQERYFYNLTEELITDEAKAKGYTAQAIEDTFSKIEDRFKSTLDYFLSKPKVSLRDYETRFEIAQFIVIQILRTKETRDFIIEAETKIREKWLHSYLKKYQPGIPEEDYLDVKLNHDHVSLLHAQYALDVDAWERMGKGLCEHIWMMADNRTSKLLYTSDQPIIKQPMANVLGGPDRKFYGMRMSYPITPTKGILIFDREYFSALKQLDGKVYVLSGSDITTFNKEQVIQSNRQIYSLDGDFTVAEETCNLQPEICSPALEKADIGVHYTKVSEGKVEEIYVIQPSKAKKRKITD